MNEGDFQQKLDEIEKSFDTFVQQFRSGESSDFSFVHDRVVTLLEASKKSSLSPECLRRLKILGENLAKMTQDVQTEMASLQTNIHQNNHRFQGLKAYTKQQIVGEN